MKKSFKKTLSVVMIAGMLALAGCGSKDEDSKDETTQEQSANTSATKGYVFESKGVSISVDADMKPVADALGEPSKYFEAASCAFEGLDKVYTYNGFEINTYPSGDKDLIASVILKSDSVTTKEGAYIGMSLEDVKAKYGTDYEDKNGMITYSKDGMKLCFLVQDGNVTSIQYSSNVLN